LFNTETLDLTAANLNIGSATCSILIQDTTALNPSNTIVTFSTGTIYRTGSVDISASLPAGITTAQQIAITLTLDHSNSNLSNLIGLPTIDPMVTIPAGSSSGLFNVVAMDNGTESSLIAVEGGSLSVSFANEAVVNVVTPFIGVFIEALSLNGDGVNDCLVLPNIGSYDSMVSIVDQHGILVYQASGYNNSSVVFCGQPNQRYGFGLGYKVVNNTYYYIITLNTPFGIRIQKGSLDVEGGAQ